MKDSRLKRNIEAVILGILLLIPCFSVLGRVLYTQWNQNAKDSYSGSNGYSIQYRFETNEPTTIDDLLVGNLYRYTVNENNLPSSNSPLVYASFVRIEYFIGVDAFDIFELDVDKVNSNIYLSFVVTSTSKFLYIRNANTTAQIFSLNILNISYIDFQYLYSFNNDFIGDLSSSLYNEIIGVDISNTGTLDNAFDYSLQNIVDKYGSGNINFLNWFGNLMFTNPSTLLYCQFANLYLNYCLYINVGYLIYYFFTFFIKMIRRLLDSFIDRRF